MDNNIAINVGILEYFVLQSIVSRAYDAVEAVWPKCRMLKHTADTDRFIDSELDDRLIVVGTFAAQHSSAVTTVGVK